jgi:ABC-type transport system involved in multi-copper enzyme maturation permease subunit
MLHRLPFAKHFSLPLLAKELVEQSARKRTYVIRTVYAVLLFLSAGLMFYDTLARFRGGNPFQVLGQGREMFDILIALQFAGVYLFMPAITCGVLTQEKERDSLALLFLTRLGPWTILFEKLLSRLVPMGTFLLLSLPLLVFAYSLGGISTARLWGGVWTLTVTTFQVGCLALACSAYFRTTVGAFVGTYLLGMVMMFGGPLLYAIMSLIVLRDVPEPRVATGLVNLFGGQGSLVGGAVYSFFDYIGLMMHEGVGLFFLFGPVTFFPFEMSWMPGGRFSTFPAYVLRTIPMLLSSGFCLLLARAFVVRRAFAPANNLLLKLFRSLDRLFKAINNNPITQGIVLIREEDNLPDTDPVAWRETSKRALGMKRYLIRLFVALEVPVVVVCMLISALGGGGDVWEAAASVMFVLWGISVLIVSVKSASLIAGERTHQTLDVLMSTPLSAREIVQQKFRGVRRLLWLLAIPFATLILFETSWRSAIASDWWVSSQGNNLNSYGYARPVHPPGLYLVCSALTVGVYLPMIAWLSFWIGLWTRSQSRAIIGALAAVVGWCVFPFLFICLPVEIIGRHVFGVAMHSGSPLSFLLLLSPATIVGLNEVNELHEIWRSPWLAVILNFVIYVPCLVLFRTLCLNFADRCLDRNEHGTRIANRVLRTPVLAAGGNERR